MQFFSVELYPTDDIQYSKDTENQIFLLTVSSLPPLCTDANFVLCARAKRHADWKFC